MIDTSRNGIPRKPLWRIGDLSTMTVQTQVSESDIAKLRVGMPAYFTTLGSRGKRWYGTLHRIEPTPQVQLRLARLTAALNLYKALGGSWSTHAPVG